MQKQLVMWCGNFSMESCVKGREHKRVSELDPRNMGSHKRMTQVGKVLQRLKATLVSFIPVNDTFSSIFL